jgi:hypothetical protein
MTKGWIGAIRVEDLPTLAAGFLVPTVLFTALAAPSLCLFGKPLAGAHLTQSFQPDQDIPVVDASVALKGLDPFTGKLCAQAAVRYFSFIRTGSDLTLRTPGMNVELV